MYAGFLNNKVILIISPQSWGNMLLAKHHYAIELAKRGNEVYYLNPPDNYHWSSTRGEKRIKIEQSKDYPNLFFINQKLYFPYRLKFHSRKLYNRLVKKQIRDILRVIPKEVDLLWSFDLGNLFPLSFFGNKSFKIFHPVDEPADEIAIIAARGADILFSVTTEILEKYKKFKIPSYFVNHGLPEEFIISEQQAGSSGTTIKIGMSGNLLRSDLDRKILLQIIRENPDHDFHFFGSYKFSQSNIGASSDKQTVRFIEALKSFPRVVLHGVLKTTDLAKELNRMDVLLICYDIQLDQSKGTNYHKVMEYLSTGKVIVSNNITTYREYPGLIRMISDRRNNESLPVFFRETVTNLDRWNAEDLINERKSFAGNNIYYMQLDKIDQHIRELLIENRYILRNEMIPET